VTEARWSEIDRPSSTWKIPGERMKMHQDHVVPLSEPALAILDKMRFETLRHWASIISSRTCLAFAICARCTIRAVGVARHNRFNNKEMFLIRTSCAALQRIGMAIVTCLINAVAFIDRTPLSRFADRRRPSTGRPVN
jgi:hypothetical protein